MSDVERPLTPSDLMAKIGLFLYLWSGFELSLTETIWKLRLALKHEQEDVVGGLNQRLELLISLDAQLYKFALETRAQQFQDVRTQALALREIRNLIVHGLVGAYAQPPNNRPAYIACRIGGFEAPTKRIKTFDMADLDRFIQATDACRVALVNPENLIHRLLPQDYDLSPA